MRRLKLIWFLINLLLTVNIYSQSRIDTIVITNTDHFIKTCNILNDSSDDFVILGTKNCFLVVKEADNQYIKTYYKMDYDSISGQNTCIILGQESGQKKQEKLLSKIFSMDESTNTRFIYSTDKSFINLPYYFSHYFVHFSLYRKNQKLLEYVIPSLIFIIKNDYGSLFLEDKPYLYLFYDLIPKIE